MTVKLTLSIDQQVVERAKQYAAARKASVSKLVEQYLDCLCRPDRLEEPPPVLGRWRGALKGSASAARRRHIRANHR